MTNGHEHDPATWLIDPATPHRSSSAVPYGHAVPLQTQPVFLHSSFRSGSTWLWQKLRSAPNTLAYYEIFHERLQTLTPAEARDINFSSWDSRHPPAAPYFLEFVQFLEPSGGIKGFDGTRSLGGFIPRGGVEADLDPSERQYVERLISSGQSRGRIPILACTRTLGRARALRRSFAGRSILLHRNLFHQWASYCAQGDAGNPYFLKTIRATVNGADHDPFLKGMSQWFDSREASSSREELFEMFIVLHLYLYAIAFDAADLVVDITAIVGDRALRNFIEQDLSEMVAHRVDLSDVQEHCDFSDLTVPCAAKTRDTIEQLAKMIPTASLSHAGVLFIEQAKDRALSEWDRFEFFNRRTRSVLVRKVEDAEKLLGEHLAETHRLKAEKDRLVVRLSEVIEAHQAERAARQAVVRNLATERDALSNRVSALETSRHELGSSLANVEIERNKLAVGLQETLAARDRMQAGLLAAEASRDEAVERENAAVQAAAGKAERSVVDAAPERKATIYDRSWKLFTGRK